MAFAQGLSLSTTSNLNSTQQTLIARAKDAFEPSAPDPSLVDQEQLPPGHYQATIATYARLDDASQANEQDDFSIVQQLRTNVLTINPAEHAVMVNYSKRLRRRQMDTNIASSAATKIGESLRRREAKDIIALYDGFSEVAGAAGNTGDITYFRGSIAYLMTENDSDYGPSPMPVDGVLHSEQISDIIADLTDPGTTAARPDSAFDEILRGWWRGSDRLYTAPIYHGGLIERDSGDDAKGAIKHKSALVEVEEGEADPWDEVDNSSRLVEVGVAKSWGEGERADPYGVEYFTDAAKTI